MASTSTLQEISWNVTRHDLLPERRTSEIVLAICVGVIALVFFLEFFGTDLRTQPRHRGRAAGDWFVLIMIPIFLRQLYKDQFSRAYRVDQRGIVVTRRGRERLYPWGDFKGYIFEETKATISLRTLAIKNQYYTLLKQDSGTWSSVFRAWSAVDVIVPPDRNTEVAVWLDSVLPKLKLKEYTMPFDRSVSIVLAIIVFPVLAIVLIWAFHSF